MFNKRNKVHAFTTSEVISMKKPPDSGWDGGGVKKRPGVKNSSTHERLKVTDIASIIAHKTPHLKQRLWELRQEKLMSEPVKNLQGMANVKFQNKKRAARFQEAWNSITYTLEPWGKALRNIEGHHGAGVVSYFVFLRYLLLVNACLFLLTFFIWVPEVIFSAEAYTSGSTAETCSISYAVNVSSNAFTLILDFFQGTGWLEQTLVFYGYYSGNGLSGTTYNLSLAYILVCLMCLISSLMLMGRNVAKSFRNNILNAGDGTTEFSNKVFGTWDYTLTDVESCAIRHKSIKHELLSDMHEQAFLKKREERMQHGCKKCCLYFTRVIINLFIVCVLGAAAYCIYYVTSYSTSYVSEHSNVSGTWNVLLLLLIQFLPSITITVLNALLPIIFQKVVAGEQYTAEFVIKITLIRTVFLRLASLAVLIVSLYTQVTCSTRDPCTSTRSPCTQITCWETYVGQQLYKLIITDFLVVIIKTLLVELPRRLLYDKCSCGLMQKVGPPEFDIPANVLDLVYTQCLYWLALTFAPLTPGFAVAKCVMTFYLKMLSALKACPPAEKPARASRTNHFFMVILLVAFFLCAVPVGFVFYSMEPSHGCGPFRIYSKMYYTITTTVDSWPGTVESIYELIISPAITGPVIIFLVLMIYYCSTLATAHKDMSDLFREQLVMEGRDKQFLLVRLQEMGGDSKPLPKQPHKMPPPGVPTLNTVTETTPPNPANDVNLPLKPTSEVKNGGLLSANQKANGHVEQKEPVSPHQPANDW